MQVGSTLALEKPENGLAGLKHWRHDLVAGLVVSLVSLPFSLGIAVASGAPPICGLISAIIAGLVLPFLGGSYVTISGPAAGLAPALLAAMLLLGHGDLKVGYPLLLVAICLTGVVQVVLAKFKLARFAAIFPASVVEGMLASIGLLIIAKQLPLIFGSPAITSRRTSSGAFVREAPSQFMAMDPKVFLVGISCLALDLRAGVVQGAVAEGRAAAGDRGGVRADPRLVRWASSGDRLIQIPENPFKHGIVPPELPGAVLEPLAVVGAVHDRPDPDVDRRRRVAGDDRGHRQDRPVPPQVRPEQDAARDGHLEHLLEHGRWADDHPRRSQEHDLHHRRRPDAVGQLLQRVLPDHLPAAGPAPDQPPANERPGRDRALHRLQAVRAEGLEARRALRRRATVRVHDDGAGHGVDRPACGASPRASWPS